MRVFAAAAVIALLAGPAYAQSQHVPKYGEEDTKVPVKPDAGDEAAGGLTAH